MKNTFKLFGIIVTVAVIGLSATACGGGSGGNGWVAGGHDGAIFFSADGRNWTSVNGTVEYGWATGIARGSRNWVVVGRCLDIGGWIAYSANGRNWTAVSDTAFGESNILDVAYGNGMFIATGEGGKMATSADGITWTAVSNTPVRAWVSINSIARGRNGWIAGADGIITSPDGETWTAGGTRAFRYSRIEAIAFGGAAGQEKWIAVGGAPLQSSHIAYSRDGSSWTVVDSPFDANMVNDVAWGGGRWVAVAGNMIAHSADGITWTLVSNNDSSSDRNLFSDGSVINAVAYKDGTWIAAGGVLLALGDKMLTSADGVTWTSVSSRALSNNLTALASGAVPTFGPTGVGSARDTPRGNPLIGAWFYQEEEELFEFFSDGTGRFGDIYEGQEYFDDRNNFTWVAEAGRLVISFLWDGVAEVFSYEIVDSNLILTEDGGRFILTRLR